VFWQYNPGFKNRTFIINADSDERIDYSIFFERCSSLTAGIKSDSKKLILIFCDQNVETILTYVSALNSQNAVILSESKINDQLKTGLIESYKPDIIFNFDSDLPGYSKMELDEIQYLVIKKNVTGEINKNLALLLSTSGTTCSPKLVRLSYENIQNNAESIFNYLPLNENERPISSLPFSYSYGLSVLNSHLLAGASIVLTNKSFVLRDFWKIFKEYNCTSFAGVPYTYQLLKKTNFHKLDFPTLKYLTQAGGSLDKETLHYFITYANEKNVLFYSMYGQTEATARISYLPPDNAQEKIGSIGRSIPGGSIRLMREDKLVEDNLVNGEIVYYGKNVMMGYAQDRKDLAKNDEMKGELRTGDIGYKDSDGYFFITGRLKRFIKIFGLKLNLDHIEQSLEVEFKCSIACTGSDDHLMIFFESGTVSESFKEEIKTYVLKVYKLHHSTVTAYSLQKFPLTPNGKKDYNKMMENLT
jgi:long-chain acyl-CoA synthetase